MHRGEGAAVQTDVYPLADPTISYAHSSQMLPAIFCTTLCWVFILQINYGILQYMNRVICDIVAAVAASVTGHQKEFFWDRLLHLPYFCDTHLF